MFSPGATCTILSPYLGLSSCPQKPHREQEWKKRKKVEKKNLP
jgi:hypothetical protein